MSDVLDPQLAHLLNQQISGLSLLIEQLNSEKQALASRDGNAIESINQQKQETVSELQVTSKALTDLLSKLSGSTDIATHKEWLLANIGETALWGKWNSLAAESKKLNEQNGKLIDASLRFQEKQLNILLPQANITKLYTASGTTEENSGLIRNRDIV
ncbi:flagellar protein FlgN [Leeia sp. TBRC 13508]|uniref:Flagellar protein FlgN n=1 Tax=Leeia speluncae TaxID=2884804 RepID=A0ABS8D1P8_9NEIS|nr:flagellar protein FlgN [Leeia speluncae]MCB6182122.1 flagellar protein FlgN [Leeia speluncae]